MPKDIKEMELVEEGCDCEQVDCGEERYEKDTLDEAFTPNALEQSTGRIGGGHKVSQGLCVSPSLPAKLYRKVRNALRWVWYGGDMYTNPYFRVSRIKNWWLGLHEKERDPELSEDMSVYGWHFGSAVCSKCNAACCKHVTLNLRDAETKLFPSKVIQKRPRRESTDQTKYFYNSAGSKDHTCIKLDYHKRCSIRWEEKPMACTLFSCTQHFNLEPYFHRAYDYCVKIKFRPVFDETNALKELRDDVTFYRKLRADIFNSGTLPERFQPVRVVDAPEMNMREIRLLTLLKDFAPTGTKEDRIRYYKEKQVDVLDRLKFIEQAVLAEEKKLWPARRTPPEYQPDEEAYQEGSLVYYQDILYVNSTGKNLGTCCPDRYNWVRISSDTPGKPKKVKARPVTRKLRSRMSIPGRNKHKGESNVQE